MALHDTPLDHLQRKRGVVVLCVVGVLLLLLGVRLIHINTALRPRLLAIVDQQHHGRSIIPARRGMIFDTRGRVLGLSRRMPDVFVDPSLVRDVDRFSEALAARVNLPPEDIARVIRRRPHSRFVVVARHVDGVTAGAVRAMADPAVGLIDRAARAYPLGTSMAHVLGWVGRDQAGMGGVELAFNDHLAGKDGRRATIRDARRRALRRTEQLTLPPVDGGHLVLTLDAEIQRITEAALANSIATFRAQSGVAIVLAPQTGDILAMATHPTFDPNEPVGLGGVTARRNRVVTDPVEPGSTFKPIIMCGALDGGYVSLTEKINCHNGVHRFGRRTIRDSKPNGLLDIRGIITHSSNIGMAVIGERMGNEALHATVRRFGLGERTGIACPGEGAGVVRSLHRWDSLSTTSIPFGYEILVTPLQLATAFAAIVNDGVRLKPRLVKSLLAPDGTVVETFDAPRIVERAASSDAARLLARDFLVSVVENGGGRAVKLDGYSVAGKTGTAKLLDPTTKRYETGAYLSLFVAAAPVEDPRLVVLVAIRRPDPSVGYYGGIVAGPAVHDILKAALPYLDVPAAEEAPLTGL